MFTQYTHQLLSILFCSTLVIFYQSIRNFVRRAFTKENSHLWRQKQWGLETHKEINSPVYFNKSVLKRSIWIWGLHKILRNLVTPNFVLWTLLIGALIIANVVVKYLILFWVFFQKHNKRKKKLDYFWG
jgi:hypothetical protein